MPNESPICVWRSTVINKRMLKGRGSIHVSINTLIPKPHTAFQWSPFEGKEKIREKYQCNIGKTQTDGNQGRLAGL